MCSESRSKHSQQILGELKLMLILLSSLFYYLIVTINKNALFINDSCVMLLLQENYDDRNSDNMLTYRLHL